MKDELTWNQRRELAKEQYINLDKDALKIAASLGVDAATVGDWITEGGWKGMKRSLLTSKKARLACYYEELEALDAEAKNAGGRTAKNFEAVNRITTYIHNLENEDSVGSMIVAAEEFTNWLLHRDVAFARKVTLQFDAFIKQKLAA
jgi:uncharacterized protein YjcR